MMTKASAAALSSWLLREHPGVFATMLKTGAQSTNVKRTGLGDDTTDDDLEPVDVTAQYIGADPSITAGFITPDVPNATPQEILNIDTSAANISTPSLLSQLGSGVGAAVSDVASFLLKGTAVVAPVAVAALNAQASVANQNAQSAVLAAQLSRAGAGIGPADIAYTSNGTPVYVPTSPVTGGLTTIPAGLGSPVLLSNGQTGYTLTPQALSNLQPTFLQQYGLWLIGGGALLALFLLG